MDRTRKPGRDTPTSAWDNARPRGPRPDKRERERLRRDNAPAPSSPPPPSTRSAPAHQRHEEVRLFGINACQAVFQHRPQDVRKVYLTEERIAAFKPVLAWCVRERVGYRIVEGADLDKLAASQHHEGVCFEVRRRAPLALDALLAQLPAAPAPALLVVLDGVGNPHNFGAVLRSAAHFGVAGIVLPADSPLTLSGAACRVAEGGAEIVALARPEAGQDVVATLRHAGFAVVATVPRAGEALFTGGLPGRTAVVFGAEGEGMSAGLIRVADHRLTIPGTGNVESLNIAASAAVLFAEYFRRHKA
ncbi:TrmH family RNA methyltransferase [Tahibacter amnicola]|uniref:rRNA methyltransferase n=1 Tax=Tahibacter amnicola TaxID=2976241 RepID=A0ABY6BJQ0_9GAMM|nr:TrmH family RNA methyltransferase [Tahibacter amnicola]UXI68831.1 rRNA methyltransferase [Tahibacter amnicola]